MAHFSNMKVHEEGSRDMLNLEAVIERANRHGELEIDADYGTVTINGRAVCDCVYGGGGCLKIRARFGKGIKAILDIDQYGMTWEAEEIEEVEEDE